jgi:hypothetical protein
MEGSGAQLPPVDEYWRLVAIREGPTRLELHGVDSGLVVELQPDNVKGYQSPDFLVLRCQLRVTDGAVGIEPILVPGMSIDAAPPVDLEEALSALEDVPLLVRDSAKRELVGARVRCRGRLGSLHAIPPDRLKVGIILRSDDVFFEVPRDAFPWLLTARHGTDVEAEGILARFDISSPWLEEVRVIAVRA